MVKMWMFREVLTQLIKGRRSQEIDLRRQPLFLDQFDQRREMERYWTSCS